MREIKLIFIALVFITACSGTKDVVDVEKPEISEEDFYRYFTEATKHALLGRYKDALQFYDFCIAAYPEKAASYYQKSNIYLALNDVDKAKHFAKKAADLDNTNKWYLLNLGNIYQYQNNLDSLIIVYERIVEISDNPEYKYNLALFYSTKKDYLKSMEIIKNLEKEIPDSREIYVLKHRNYAGLNFADSAITQLESLIYFFPDQVENYGMLAEYLSEINRVDESKKVYSELLQKDSSNGLANLSFGDFYLKQSQKDSAFYYYSIGLKAEDISLEDKLGILYNYMYDGSQINSDSTFLLNLIEVLNQTYNDPRSYSLEAEYYLKVENYKSAASSLKHAIDAGSDNYVIWEQYLMISNFIGLHEKVKEVFPEAQKRFGNNINVYLFGGYSLYMLEDYNDIIAYQDTALKLDFVEVDQKIQLLNLYADCYRELEDYEKSDSLYEEILNLQPNNLMIRNNYSYYLSIRNIKLERAEELSRLTIQTDPKNATYLDTYGWILYMQGNYKEAAKYIELAIKNGAYNNPEVLDHYGDVMFKLNRCSEAVEAWKTALTYDSERSEISIKIDETNCEE